MSPLLLTAAAVSALLYLVQVYRGRKGWLKVLPATALAAASIGVPWVAAAFVLCALGDAFLLDKDRFFLHGLVAFLLGHIAFVVGLAPFAGPVPAVAWVLFGSFAVAMLAALLPRVRGVLRFAIPVYATALVSLGLAGVATSPLAGIGATVFLISDGVLAWNRFRSPLLRADLWVMITYYGALLCLAAAVQDLS